MTKLDEWIKKVEEACKRVPRGPWSEEYVGYDSYAVKNAKGNDLAVCIHSIKSERTAMFIADARTALPQALEVIKRQREALEFYSSLDAYPIAYRNENREFYAPKDTIIVRHQKCDYGEKAKKTLCLDPKDLEER